MKESKIEKKIDNIAEMIRQFQGEIGKGLKETNLELNELRLKVDALYDAHQVDLKTGKLSHGRGSKGSL